MYRDLILVLRSDLGLDGMCTEISESLATLERKGHVKLFASLVLSAPQAQRSNMYHFPGAAGLGCTGWVALLNPGEEDSLRALPLNTGQV